MLRMGHYGVALGVYAPVGAVTFALGLYELVLLGGGITLGGAMLPDLDEQIPGIRHRGPTHTVWFALLIGAVFGLIGAVIGTWAGLTTALEFGAFAALVGTLTVLAHLLADLLTPAGIRPFAPLCDTEYTLNITHASHRTANYLLLTTGIGAVIGGIILARVLR